MIQNFPTFRRGNHKYYKQVLSGFVYTKKEKELGLFYTLLFSWVDHIVTSHSPICVVGSILFSHFVTSSSRR